MDEIVWKIEPEPTPAGRATPAATLGAEFDICVTATSAGGLKKAGESWAGADGGRGTSLWGLRCDEGAYLGGEDSAPPPLVYFAAGIAFCLLTQITRCAEMLKLELADVRLDQAIRFFREGSIRGGTIVTGQRGIELSIDVATAEEHGRVAELVRVATASCFAHGSLSADIPVRLTLAVNGETIDPDGD